MSEIQSVLNILTAATHGHIHAEKGKIVSGDPGNSREFEQVVKTLAKSFDEAARGDVPLDPKKASAAFNNVIKLYNEMHRATRRIAEVVSDTLNVRPGNLSSMDDALDKLRLSYMHYIR